MLQTGKCTLSASTSLLADHLILLSPLVWQPEGLLLCFSEASTKKKKKALTIDISKYVVTLFDYIHQFFGVYFVCFLIVLFDLFTLFSVFFLIVFMFGINYFEY